MKASFLFGCVAASAQPSARDEAWIHAPLRLLNEMKSGHLRSQRHHSVLLSQHGQVEESVASSQIAREIGSAEHALEKELQGHPEILAKEQHLLEQASDMAKRAGHFRKQGAMLASKMSKSKVRTSDVQHHRVSNGALLKSLEKQEKGLMQDGFGILHATQDLKVNVVEAIGESSPDVAVRIEKILDVVGRDQKTIIKGEDKMVRSLGHVSSEQAALDSRHQQVVRSSSESVLKHDEVSEEKMTHADQAVLESAENIKGQVAKLLGATNTTDEVNNLMAQVESIQQNVIRSDKDAVFVDLNIMKEAPPAPKIERAGRDQQVLAQEAAKSQAGYSQTRAHLAKQQKVLQAMVSRRDIMVKESRHLLVETDQAQAALEEQLGGTAVGTEIAEILGKAQTEERKAAEGTAKQALRAHSEIGRVADLMHTMTPLA